MIQALALVVSVYAAARLWCELIDWLWGPKAKGSRQIPAAFAVLVLLAALGVLVLLGLGIVAWTPPKGQSIPW